MNDREAFISDVQELIDAAQEHAVLGSRDPEDFDAIQQYFDTTVSKFITK